VLCQYGRNQETCTGLLGKFGYSTSAVISRRWRQIPINGYGIDSSSISIAVDIILCSAS